MAATPDRTTIKAAATTLVSLLTSNLVADPPTAAKPFRGVTVGAAGVEELARPFLSVLLTKARPAATTNDDKLMEVTLILRVVADATAADPHAAMLDAVGAVDDYFDSVRDVGLIDGAEGFDDRTWNFEYPKATSGARVVTAQATQTMVVKVERGFNREPAT